MKEINIGIMGAGRIANRIADTVNQMSIAKIKAVASREVGRAKLFAEKYSIEKAHSYEELMNDDDVDLVYIATPASHHMEHAIRCLKHGKHVLVEKPFAVNAFEADKVLSFARVNKLLAAEAIWPRYMPMAHLISKFCKSEQIGDITSITCNLGYPVTYKQRVMDINLCGGALLEVGIYPLTFAVIVFGHSIKKLSVSAAFDKSGVDLSENVGIEFNGGEIASIFSSICCHTNRLGVIHGNKGYAEVHNINNYEKICVYNADRVLISQVDRPEQLTGYEYQIYAVWEAINKRLTECPQMPHDEIVRMMKLMDNIRSEMGLYYPSELRTN